MKAVARYFDRPLIALAVAACLAACTGCDDGGFDHTPPPGQGSLIIDNNTLDDLSLYVDGEYLDRVGDGDERVFDLAPGVYRVVLDEQGGSRNYADDVDVLEGRLTILDVRPVFGGDVEYVVIVDFD